MDDISRQLMRITSHSDLFDLWLRAKERQPLQGEEATLARAMQEHTEYHDRWERLDESDGSEIVVNGVNPVLHICTHSIIENQLEQNDPPEVRNTLEALLKRGAARHEAIHAIGQELFMEIHKTLQTKHPFNQITYKRRLGKLAGGKRL